MNIRIQENYLMKLKNLNNGRTSYSRRRKNDDIKGYILLFISAIIILGILGAYFVVRGNSIILTKDTLCPEDGPYGHTVFLIDRTDTYSKIQIAQTKNILLSFKDKFLNIMNYLFMILIASR